MLFRQFVNDDLGCGSYLVGDREAGEAVVVDPAFAIEQYLDAAAAEGALHLDDVLARRTRLSIQTFDRGVEAAEPAARIMGDVLGWDEDRIASEVELYRGRVDAERRSQEQPSDEAADRIRRSAPDAYAAPTS